MHAMLNASWVHAQHQGLMLLVLSVSVRLPHQVCLRHCRLPLLPTAQPHQRMPGG